MGTTTVRECFSGIRRIPLVQTRVCQPTGANACATLSVSRSKNQPGKSRIDWLNSRAHDCQSPNPDVDGVPTEAIDGFETTILPQVFQSSPANVGIEPNLLNK